MRIPSNAFRIPRGELKHVHMCTAHYRVGDYEQCMCDVCVMYMYVCVMYMYVYDVCV